MKKLRLIFANWVNHFSHSRIYLSISSGKMLYVQIGIANVTTQCIAIDCTERSLHLSQDKCTYCFTDLFLFYFYVCFMMGYIAIAYLLIYKLKILNECYSMSLCIDYSLTTNNFGDITSFQHFFFFFNSDIDIIIISFC